MANLHQRMSKYAPKPSHTLNGTVVLGVLRYANYVYSQHARLFLVKGFFSSKPFSYSVTKIIPLTQKVRNDYGELITRVFELHREQPRHVLLS